MSTPASATKKAAPRRPAGTSTTGGETAPQTRSTSLQQHLTVLSECNVMSPEGFYAWSEALRALSMGVAFFVHASASQFEQAARKGARDNVDGRMTMAQKIEMFKVMRRISKAESNAADSLLTTATQAARAYGLLEDFLESLESDNVARPHRSAKGGFDLYGGN